MKIIEITPKKVDEMSEHVEDILMVGEKLRSCLEKLSKEMYSERRYSDDDEYSRHEMMSGERRYGRR